MPWATSSGAARRSIRGSWSIVSVDPKSPGGPRRHPAPGGCTDPDGLHPKGVPHVAHARAAAACGSRRLVCRPRGLPVTSLRNQAVQSPLCGHACCRALRGFGLYRQDRRTDATDRRPAVAQPIIRIRRPRRWRDFGASSNVGCSPRGRRPGPIRIAIMISPPPTSLTGIHLMAKPIGPLCNLDCGYCFYLEKENLFPAGKRFRMSAHPPS